MKVAVYSLLLINLGVFAWFSWFVNGGEPVVQTASSGLVVNDSLPQLMLADENDVSASDASIGKPSAQDNTRAVNAGGQPAIGGTTENLVTAVSPEPLCVSLGPFQNDQFANAATDRLAQGGYISAPRATDGQVRVGFWVNIVAGATRDDAQAIADQLRDRGVSDFYIVPGDDSNIISLGVYSGQERAQRRYDEIAALGFSTVIDDRFQAGTVQWLDFMVADPALINHADYDTGSGMPVELVSRPCPANQMNLDAASG